ncbi:DMT family transporter [Fulvivirga sediminis]|uniref:DMT family transporter n=1 Tax=Fulvivirga sediminis TaxID=2803949 RepID=A0A937K1I9_9BACT|nr:DMT family transporter [Fulvivirga sediminis]MBL3657536.1 DMT family transporter [Fulvivirga sediminis]
MSNTKDFLKLHFIVLIWGFTAILGLLISINSVEIVFYRTLMASVTLWVMLKLRKRNLKIGKSAILKVAGTGLIIAAHWILFFAAARVSTASVCLAGAATCSLWTSFIEPLFNKRKVKGFEVGLGLIVILGLYVIFQFEFNHALGLFMGIVAAMLAAIFSVINGKFSKEYNQFVITYYEMIGACVGCLLFFPIYKYFFLQGEELKLIPQGIDWFYLVILSLVCTVYAFSASVELMKRISAFMVNLTINLEPVYGILLAVIIFGEKEKMEPGFYYGTGIILLAVLLYPLLNKIFKRKPLEVDNLR